MSYTTSNAFLGRILHCFSGLSTNLWIVCVGNEVCRIITSIESGMVIYNIYIHQESFKVCSSRDKGIKSLPETSHYH